MQDMNYCRFIGTVISDVRLTQTQGGVDKAEFGLLLKSPSWDKETRQDVVRTEVFGMEAWFTQAIECSELGKGDRVSIEAQASRRQFEVDGKKQEKVRFTVLTVTVLKLGNHGASPSAPAVDKPLF